MDNLWRLCQQRIGVDETLFGDLVQNLIETCCIVHYMNKTQAAVYLFLEYGIEPEFTEKVWDELERQNPEFFKEYKFRRTVSSQIEIFNRLLVYLSQAMVGNFIADTSAALPNGGDPTRSTSTHVSSPDNMHENIAPPPISENQGVNHINNDPVYSPMNVASASLPMGDLTCSTSTHVSNLHNMQHNRNPPSNSENQRVRIPNDEPVHVPRIEPSAIMHPGMNSQATHFSVYNEGSSQVSREPHYDPQIQNQPGFEFSTPVLQDILSRYTPPDEAYICNFPATTSTNVHGNLNVHSSDRRGNGSANDFNVQG